MLLWWFGTEDLASLKRAWPEVSCWSFRVSSSCILRFAVTVVCICGVWCPAPLCTHDITVSPVACTWSPPCPARHHACLPVTLKCTSVHQRLLKLQAPGMAEAWPPRPDTFSAVALKAACMCGVSLYVLCELLLLQSSLSLTNSGKQNSSAS